MIHNYRSLTWFLFLFFCIGSMYGQSTVVKFSTEKNADETLSLLAVLVTEAGYNIDDYDKEQKVIRAQKKLYAWTNDNSKASILINLDENGTGTNVEIFHNQDKDVVKKFKKTHAKFMKFLLPVFPEAKGAQ